jgi:bifunctional non-homologous end joining protein LigD
MARRALPKSKRQYVKVQAAAIEASKLKQAVPAACPSFIDPALATLVDKPPRADGWVHEIKFDGYRLQLHVREQQGALFTRRGHD